MPSLFPTDEEAPRRREGGSSLPIGIRRADARRDAGACAAIYAPFVRESAVSFEEQAPDGAAFAERIERVSRAYPWLVAVLDGEVAGYAYASRHRDRAAYRWAAEVGVYVAADRRRCGVGRRLYGALLPLLARQGLHVALAAITLPNDASVSLHEAFGFRPAGVFRRVGWKAGAWRDVGWWQAELIAPAAGAASDAGEAGGAGDAPPAEPGAPAEL